MPKMIYIIVIKGLWVYYQIMKIAETARVLSVDGRRATVRVEGGSTCRRCGLASMGLCRAGAEAGDIVYLSLRDGARRKGFFYAYFLPILVLFTALGAGLYLNSITGFGGLDVVVALLGLSASLIYSIKKLSGLERKERLSISRVLRDGDFSQADNPEAQDYLRAYSESPKTLRNM